jgi:hypothetical protein
MATLSHARLFKFVILALLYAAIIVGGSFAGDWIARFFKIEIYPHNEPLFHNLIMLALAAYALLTAIPFVPGVEIGLGLIMAFGPPIVPIVYLATIFALTASYSVGRLVPERWLEAGFRKLGLIRAADLVQSTAALPMEERVRHLTDRAPKRFVPFLLRNRLWALAILFNLPGSALVGGGGGISLAAGISRLVTYPQFLITTALAVSPIPIAVLVAAALGRSFLN